MRRRSCMASAQPNELWTINVATVAAVADKTLWRSTISLGVDSYTGLLMCYRLLTLLLCCTTTQGTTVDATFSNGCSYSNNTVAVNVQTVSVFGDLVSRSMVLGQSRTALQYGNFRWLWTPSRWMVKRPQTKYKLVNQISDKYGSFIRSLDSDCQSTHICL